MHGLFKGICNYNMQNKIILEFKYFSIETLNNRNYRIQFFDYRPSEIKNHPPLITEKSKVSLLRIM